MLLIKPCKGRITSNFNLKRRHPITGKITPHWGTDFGNATDNTIVAAQSGKVRVASHSNTGFGNYVVITHSNGWETVYAHLKSIAVKTGQSVAKGQYIGVKGTTGNSTGIHLHFELSKGRWTNSYTHHVDPVGYIDDPSIPLRKDVSGPRVTNLQNDLNKLGYNLVADGVFGDATDKAIKDYQRKNKLTIDGIVGAATFRSIADSINKPVARLKEEAKGKDLDEMSEKLPETQRNDMKNLLTKAYKDKTFHVDHTSKVDTMTRGQALDLLISYVSRTVK